MSRLDTRVRRLLELRTANSLAQQAAKEAKAELDAYEAELWSELEDEGTKTWSGDLGEGFGQVRITRRETQYAEILDKQALIDSIKEEGLESELLRPDLRKKNLNALVKANPAH